MDCYEIPGCNYKRFESSSCCIYWTKTPFKPNFYFTSWNILWRQKSKSGLNHRMAWIGREKYNLVPSPNKYYLNFIYCLTKQVFSWNFRWVFVFFWFLLFPPFFFLTLHHKGSISNLGLAQGCWQNTNMQKCSLQVEGSWFWQSSKPAHSQCLEIWKSHIRPSTPQLPWAFGV